MSAATILFVLLCREFRLEADLPFSAEEMISDFRSSDDGSVSAVAIQRKRILPLVNELHQLGMRISGILPASLVTAQALLETRQPPSTGLLTLLDDRSAEHIWLEAGAVWAW